MTATQKSIPKIPDGMVELMKNLVKSVLKEQPENIYLFAAEHFENLVLKRDGSLDKEYSVFRKYEDELERRRDKEGCSRCRCLVNVEGNADDDLPKQADDENSIDMSVSGVGIRAVPRHYKPLKSQKSRQQLENIQSESMDSTIEDERKSVLVKSHDNKDAIFHQISMESTDKLQKSTVNGSQAASLGPTNEVNEEKIVQLKKIPAEKIIQPLIEEIIKPISARKLVNDRDVPPDAPTNETRVGDTDRTAIENAASTLATDNQNYDLNPLDIDTKEDNSTDDKPTDTSTEVQLLTESPKTKLLNFQKSDRIRTPESDSGLSEKSFNLNIHEETTANETYKAEPIKEKDSTDKEVIPLNTSRISEMKREEDEKMDDEQMNRSKKLDSNANESEQTQYDGKKNEHIEERNREIARVSSFEEQKPTNDQPTADPQEMIADNISEQIKDPNNLVPKGDSLKKTELFGSASSEKHKKIATEKNLEDERLADLENNKIEEEPSFIEESKTIENDQIADSTEKHVILIENKTDEPIPPDEETDSSSNELKLIEENEELPKTTQNEISYLHTKASSVNEKMIELNEQKPLEKETSEINEIPIENSENRFEIVKINKLSEENPTELVETTDSQSIAEKTANNFDGVEMAEANERESIIAEGILNDTESYNVVHETEIIDVLSGEESGKIKSNDIIPVDERSESEDHVDSKWETTTDAIAQKVEEQDGHQVELRMNRLTEDQKPDSIQDPNQDLRPTDSIKNNSEESHEELNSDVSKPNQSFEEVEIINRTTKGLNGEHLVKDSTTNYFASVDNETNDPISELSNLEKKGTENEVVPLKLDSKETIVYDDLKDVEKDIDDISNTNSPKKDEFSVTETSALETDQVQSKSIPTSPNAQSNESSLEIGKQTQRKSPPISPGAQINESPLEIGEKISEQLNSPPTTPKNEGSESKIVEQLHPKSTPSSPNTNIDSTNPTLDTECEKPSNKTEINDQKLSEETTTLVDYEPTDSSETTIIERNLESTIIKNNELSIANENHSEYRNISSKSSSPQERSTEDPETNVNEIEITHSENKTNIDDAISEKSSSVKDYLYEKAETEIIGDESVQELELSIKEIEQTEEISKDYLTRPNTAKQQTDSPQQQDPNKNDNNQIQPDSLDNSLEPIANDTKSVDSLEVENKDAESDKCDAKTPRLRLNEKNTAHAQIDEGSVQNTSTKTNDKEKDEEENDQIVSISVTAISSIESKPGSSSQDLMGDSVKDKGSYGHMNNRMKTELTTLDFDQNVKPIQLSNIEEVDTPVTPKSADNVIKFVDGSKVKVLDELKKPHTKIETIVYSETESKESMTTKLNGEVNLEIQHENQDNPNKNESTNKSGTKTQNNLKTINYWTPLRHISRDSPSSDLSDTDSEKPELISNELCIDENSRDEHDDVSEVENFDLSSCEEDSLEAMYYMLRKNEILIDEQKKTNKCDDEKITFPEKATKNLKNVFREVSGKKMICSVGLMNNSSADDVILKQLSSDSDALQMHVLPNSEIDSSTEPKSCALNTTDDEYLMEKNNTSSHGMVHDKTDSKMKQYNNSLTNDEKLANECDTFDDDVIQANIERKIQAPHDFNVSTAFAHLKSTNEETGSFESAATKIQAGARGLLARRRLGRSEADVLASIEKRSSIRKTAIDKSLDNFVNNRQNLMQDQERSKIENGDLRPVPSIDDDSSVQEIIEVKMEQKENNPSRSIVINENIIETMIETDEKETGSDDSRTAQRRLTLQRGDAMQRYSTPELEKRQLLIDKETIDKKEPTNDEAPASPKQDKANTSIHKSFNSASKLPTDKQMKTLGPRQRSMPVQFESMLMRILPIPEQKRIKSANNSTPKETKQRSNLF